MGGKFRSKNKSKPPVERLDRSHRRLEERLEELVARAGGIAKGKALKASWEAVNDVLAFLERAGMRHEEDEEETVFPRLAAIPALRPLLRDLRADHRRQRKLVSELGVLCRAHKQAGTPRKLGALALQIQSSYLLHIEREDAELLPAIKQHIDAETEAEMAHEMAERRS